MWILGLKRLNDLTVSALLTLPVDVAYKIDSRVALTLLPCSAAGSSYKSSQ